MKEEEKLFHSFITKLVIKVNQANAQPPSLQSESRAKACKAQK
jgi:hypothetical protein